MTTDDISKQLNNLESQMRSMRIQVTLLGLKDTKQKHPRLIQLENTLHNFLQHVPRRNFLIDECLEEIEVFITIKPKHHKLVQN